MSFASLPDGWKKSDPIFIGFDFFELIAGTCGLCGCTIYSDQETIDKVRKHSDHHFVCRSCVESRLKPTGAMRMLVAVHFIGDASEENL